VSRDIALLPRRARRGVPGVRIEPSRCRQYVEGPLYSADHRIHRPVTEDELAKLRDSGYLPTDQIGRTGLELQYEEYLRGTYWLARDRARRLSARDQDPRPDPPQARGNVVLTIDDGCSTSSRPSSKPVSPRTSSPKASPWAMIPERRDLAMVSTPAYDKQHVACAASPRRARRPQPRRVNRRADLRDGCRHPLVNKAVGRSIRPARRSRWCRLSALTVGTAPGTDRERHVERDQRVGVQLLRLACPRERWTSSTASRMSSDIYFYSLAAARR